MQVRDVPVIKSFHLADFSLKNYLPQQPHFTSGYASSQLFISCISQLAAMTLQNKAAQLSPFSPSPGQFYNILLQTCTSELGPCRSEGVKFPPLASRECAGRKVHREDECLAKDTPRYLMLQSNTNTSLQG